MNDHKPEQNLQDALNDVAAVAPSASAREQALQAALVAFDDVQTEKNHAARQGFLQRWRQRVKSTTQRLNIMANFQRKWLYSGMAAASVAVLAVMVSQQLDLPKVENRPQDSQTTNDILLEYKANIYNGITG